jgi:transcriptional regulator with XRE-family HTH domain
MGGTLPIAVQNLRRIWDSKKEQFETNQTEAAKKLGWTQGAFSQYLNNITELNHDAIAKLANFLEVDPFEIDPKYNPIEANRIRVPVLYIHPKTPSNYPKITYRRRIITTVCEENNDALCAVCLEKDLRPIGYKGQMVLCSDMFKLRKPRLTPGRIPEWYVIKRKNSDPLEAVKITECPPNKELEAKLLPLLSYIIN